jgi:uncharacterized Zn-binding protein involved in type VI secretion
MNVVAENLLTKATQATGSAAALQPNAKPASAPEPGAFDVWKHTYREVSRRADHGELHTLGATVSGEALLKGLKPDQLMTDGRGLMHSAAGQARELKQQFLNLVGLGDPKEAPHGVLARVGATLGMLTSIEQMLSTPFAVIPYPALPAVRITDRDIGLPHVHAHPPNVTGAGPPIAMPSTGPVIPIPLVSGATRTLINGLPAARCGDMGLAIWCGGYFPMYEIFLGSSNVWIEGQRAARVGVDITKHCVFSSPKPSDPPLGPMVGMTVSASPNVLIGGVPLPSLTSMVMGKAFQGLIKGLGKVLGKVKALKSAAAGRFSRGKKWSVDGEFIDDTCWRLGSSVDPSLQIGEKKLRINWGKGAWVKPARFEFDVRHRLMAVAKGGRKRQEVATARNLVPRSQLGFNPGAHKFDNAGAHKFYSVPNRAGGRVWLSTGEIHKDTYKDIVDSARRRGKVTILTGTHGSTKGEYGGKGSFRDTPYPEGLLRDNDLAWELDENKYGHLDNVEIRDVTRLTREGLDRVLNSPGDVICGWCYSDRAVKVLDALGLLH